MTAYYNEIDPYAAEWLQNLILLGAIAPGDVDTRSIEDVRPDDLRGYTQCHFFAGIGVWSHALRLAAWPDDRPIWTGSCPCQPFSAAGQGLGFADERHLWPTFHHLIAECRPAIVVGEQVASAAVDAWIDLVHADLEAVGYAFGSVPFPSAGVGAPHIRDRNYWVAYADSKQYNRSGASRPGRRIEYTDGSAASRLDDAHHQGLEGQRSGYQAEGGRVGAVRSAAAPGESGGLGDAIGAAGERHAGSVFGAEAEVDRQGRANGGVAVRSEYASAGMDTRQPGPTNGYWRAADWLGCRDGKWRPVEPGAFPLAHGAAARVGRLRAYGNAINSQAAKAFIEVLMEAQP